MIRKLKLVFGGICLAGIALHTFACGSSDDSTNPATSPTADAGSPTQKCTPGQSIACSGTSGCSGAQICNASGTFDPCVCTGPSDSGSDAAAANAPSAPTGVSATAMPVAYTVTTLAGSGTAAFAEGLGTAASFNSPLGLAVDAAGNVFVADGCRIRKITPVGLVSTLAGSGTCAFADGMGAAAGFMSPLAIVVINAAGDLYVSDSSRIRKVTAAGLVSTVAGNTGVATASFKDAEGMALDPTGNLYFADEGNNRVRKMTPTFDVSIFAGSGTATYAPGTGVGASFLEPRGITMDAAGNLYVADGRHISKVTTPGAVVSLFAGGGPSGGADGAPNQADVVGPYTLAIDATGNLYFGDSTNRVRKATPDGTVSTIAGSGMGFPNGTGAFADGVGTGASFFLPLGIAIDATGVLYVGDTGNNRIRKLTSGVGRLTVTWIASSTVGGSPIDHYTATATAAGQTTRICTADASATSCALTGLASGVVYAVSVTATNGTSTGSPSASLTAIPN